jgi:hypothetical protein
VRHGKWKYVSDGGARSLHDLASDPEEKNDLLASEAGVVREVEGRLAQWERDVRSPRLRGFAAQ